MLCFIEYIVCVPDRGDPSRMSLSQSFLRQSSRHSGRRLPAVGIPASIFGFRQNHFHCVCTSFDDHRLQRVVNIVSLISFGHFFIILHVRPVGDGTVLVEAMAMTALNLSSIIGYSNIFSISLQSCRLFGTCDTPYQMLSNANFGILSVIFLTTVLKYASSVRNFMFYSIVFLEK